MSQIAFFVILIRSRHLASVLWNPVAPVQEWIDNIINQGPLDKSICQWHLADYVGSQRWREHFPIASLGGDQDFFRPVDLHTHEEGGPSIRQKKLALVLTDVQDGVVPPRVVDERDVDVAGQVLVHLLQAFNQRLLPVAIEVQHFDAQVCQALDKERC